MTKKAKVIAHGSHGFEIGEIVTLVRDDGTNFPPYRNDAGEEFYVLDSDLKFLTPEDVDLSKVPLHKLFSEIERRVKEGGA